MSPFTKDEILDIYSRRAGFYDVSATSYRLIGFREKAYRMTAIDALKLQPGDTVVDLCCGTGRNFTHLRDYVGPEGKIIGVDLSVDMLSQAQGRIYNQGWDNIELVHADVAEFEFPNNISGVLSTYAITLSPDYDSIIYRVAKALKIKGRVSIADFKIPDGWTSIFVKPMVAITRPFGVTEDLGNRHPWVSVRKYTHEEFFKTYFYGFVYVSAGERR